MHVSSEDPAVSRFPQIYTCGQVTTYISSKTSQLELILAICLSRHQAEPKEEAMQLVEKSKLETVLPDFWGPNQRSHATGNSFIPHLVDKQTISLEPSQLRIICHDSKTDQKFPIRWRPLALDHVDEEKLIFQKNVPILYRRGSYPDRWSPVQESHIQEFTCIALNQSSGAQDPLLFSWPSSKITQERLRIAPVLNKLLPLIVLPGKDNAP
ncbi:uncharacterized protein P174DRAFT_435766 [Aspergillus novofumigatus IBT 16806]|uniref:Uncharacterized protein n=1 Tax=Aspergillus novofumigatus (strain IBT 16806) TaxID=1392255 RepID=A0A2I1BUL6_ASPN1|nr:uncharacterized protein P174DRAFT_435766 [Aspergillus novofumigatus IBT 16806]PKX89065.1 hypothetical protein P174DRAFT_435766 [Aspergillus novofumigatus IBT 16806]